MSDAPNAELQLDDVARRFADSEQALREAREQLEHLATARESSERSAASLGDSAAALRSFAAAATSLLGELESTHAKTRELLSAGARLLDGSEFQELKDAVSGFGGRLAEVETRFADLEAARAQIEELRAELDRRTAALSGRQRGKLGIR